MLDLSLCKKKKCNLRRYVNIFSSDITKNWMLDARENIKLHTNLTISNLYTLATQGLCSR